MILVDSQDASPIYEQVYRRIRTLIMTEALKEGEQITLFATIMAVSRSFASETVHSRSLLAPSPSAASILVIFMRTRYNAS